MKNKKLISMFLALSIVQIPVLAEFEDISDENIQSDNEIIYEEEAYDEQVPEPLEIPEELAEPDSLKTDRFIVKYKSVNKLAKKSAKKKIYEVQGVKEVNSLETAENSTSVFSVLSASEAIDVVSTENKVNIEEFKNKLMEESGAAIEYVQPDYKIELSAADIQEDATKHIADTNENISVPAIETEITSEKEIEKIQEDATDELPALAEADVKASGAIIALLDTGVDIYHNQLINNIYENSDELGNDEDGNSYFNDINGWNFYDDNNIVYDAEEGLDQAHGTHIAGIISSVYPEARILPLKVFKGGTAYTSDMIEAIRYAELMGAEIINCSWGCTADNTALKEAIENSSMTFVCAAGNNRMDISQTPIYPACYDLENVISVASVNEDGGLSYFSNYGNADIAAPGRDIESAFPENETGHLSGTSMSAGYVSGALASVYTNGSEAISRLFSTSDKLQNLQDYVTEGRRLNIDNLLSNVISTDIIDVNPAEDFNIDGYTRTPAENWELFSALDNIAVAMGDEFRMVLKADGSVWTWGNNTYGQLGNGTYTSSNVPQQVPYISNVVEIAAGKTQAVVRTAQNYAYTWGSNAEGCLGIGTTTKSNVPVLMTNGTGVTGIGASENNTYVLKNGDVYACGSNRWGSVGDGTRTDRTILTRVNLSGIRKITGGGAATFAISNSNTLYSWGHDGHGRLGDGGKSADRDIPQMIISSGIADVSMGMFDCMAVTTDGNVYNWGYGYGESPVMRSDISGVTQAVAGRQAQFVRQGNVIKSRGFNDYGVLGVGDTSYKSAFTAVSGEYKDFTVKDRGGIAIGVNGCIYEWGKTDYGNNTYVTAPEKLSTKINDFGGDDFENATPVTIGETKGNLITTNDVDFYKFTPTVTGFYSVYSISGLEDTTGYNSDYEPEDIDLVCKIYTKNADGTYTLQYSCDDCRVISNNYNDFYLLKKFTANTEYYISIYSYDEYYKGEYSLYINREIRATPSKGAYFNVNSGEAYTFAVRAKDLADIKNAEFNVTFTESHLQLEDACAQTYAPDISVGQVLGSNIEITEIGSSCVKFKVNKTNHILTGAVNMLRFRSNFTGSTYIRVSITR